MAEGGGGDGAVPLLQKVRRFRIKRTKAQWDKEKSLEKVAKATLGEFLKDSILEGKCSILKEDPSTGISYMNYAREAANVLEKKYGEKQDKETNDEIYLNLAHAQMMKGDMEAALDSAQKCYDLTKNVEALVTMAKSNSVLGRGNEAVDCCLWAQEQGYRGGEIDDIVEQFTTIDDPEPKSTKKNINWKPVNFAAPKPAPEAPWVTVSNTTLKSESPPLETNVPKKSNQNEKSEKKSAKSTPVVEKPIAKEVKKEAPKPALKTQKTAPQPPKPAPQPPKPAPQPPKPAEPKEEFDPAWYSKIDDFLEDDDDEGDIHADEYHPRTTANVSEPEPTVGKKPRPREPAKPHVVEINYESLSSNDDGDDDGVLQRLVAKQKKHEADKAPSWSKMAAKAPPKKAGPPAPPPTPAPVPKILHGPERFEKYEYILACDTCYFKKGEGINNVEYKWTSHQCDKKYLLIRKNSKEKWMKIRPYPDKAKEQEYGGKFKFCQQFTEMGVKCKLGEGGCSFGHYQEEIILWTYDRQGRFHIAEFIENARHGRKTSTSSSGSREKRSQSRDRHLSGNLLSSTEVWGSTPAINATGKAATAQPKNGTASAKKALLKTPPKKDDPQAQTAPKLQNAGAKKKIDKLLDLEAKPILNPENARMFGVWNDAAAGGQIVEQDARGKAVLPGLSNQGYDWELLCLKDACVRREGVHFKRLAQPHDCSHNVLFVRPKSFDIWLLIREKPERNTYKGRNEISLCNYFSGMAEGACPHDLGCLFPHNVPEQYLWTLEKDGQFSIGAFIKASSQTTDIFTVDDLVDKYGYAFRFICFECYKSRPPRVSFEHPQEPACRYGHRFAQHRILCCIKDNGQIVLIAKRMLTHKGAFYKFCKFLRYCYRFNTVGCLFAHDAVEKDVWLVEQSQNMTQPQIVARVMDICERQVAWEAQQQQQWGQPQQQQWGQPPQWGQPLQYQPPPQMHEPPRTAADAAKSKPTAKAVPVKAPTPPPPKEKFPLNLVYVCQLCWKDGRLSMNEKNSEKCGARQGGHLWQTNKVVMKLPEKQVVRQIPNGVFIQKNRVAKECKMAYGGTKCWHKVCNFAHNDSEIAVWNWQQKNRVENIDELVQRSNRSKQQESQQKAAPDQKVESAPLTSKQMVSATVNKSRLLAMEKILAAENAFYCPYCSVMCTTKMKWDQHCSDDLHKFNVNTDKDRQWNHRQPPWTIAGDKYALCADHKNGGKCRYSNVGDSMNTCKMAHSQEELDEWTERYSWRQNKLKLAQSDMCSYMDALIEEYEKASNKPAIITENIPGVTVHCDEDLSVYMVDKSAQHTWTFHVNTKKTHPHKLKQVALLLASDRLHFSLMGVELEDGCQIAEAETLRDPQNPDHHVVIVAFSAKMFGSFKQTLVLDFGTRPVMRRKLRVDVGRKEEHEKIFHYRKLLTLDRWTHENREIVCCHVEDDFDSWLQEKYKPVVSASEVVTHGSVVAELNEHNYVEKMKKMVQIEEIELRKLVASYDLRTTIELQKRISEEGFVFAMEGTLFARVPLNEELTEDFDAGRAVLRHVNYVYLSPVSAKDKKVYEAEIVSRERFDYDGRGREYIYLWLSGQLCSALTLRDGQTLEVEVQFQLDRAHLCRILYGLDRLPSTDIVFPNLAKTAAERSEMTYLEPKSLGLNKDQMKIVNHIVKRRTVRPPPLVVYGPFGTGKTETIAQCCMILLQEMPDARILVCCHVNKSADQYIMRHLSEFVQLTAGIAEIPTIKMLRVYDSKRKPNTVDGEVKKYCLMSPNYEFRLPTEAELSSCNLVLSTNNMAPVLAHLGPGHFTHIFVDEAGQALECEAAMPLSLAGDNTCIVLAGDHLQTSNRVYSTICLEQKMDQSLLERLYERYEKLAPQATFTLLKTSLTWNYRSKEGIVRYISAQFYGDPRYLTAKRKEPEFPDIRPIAFYSTKGQESQDKSETSPYNWAEAHELVARIKELLDKWPELPEPEGWGDKDLSQICVVTPYAAQVKRIRHLLRTERLSGITVVNVHAVPGHEFRAVFVSIVRTRHLVYQDASLLNNNNDDPTLDFGFLSDKKLVNTALTRAQSFVGVVGDPVAMCAIGANILVWRTYLKHCFNYESVTPESLTYEAVKQEVMKLSQQKGSLEYEEIEIPDIVNNYRTSNEEMDEEEEEKVKSLPKVEIKAEVKIEIPAMPALAVENADSGVAESTGQVSCGSPSPPLPAASFSAESRAMLVSRDEIFLQLAREAVGNDPAFNNVPLTSQHVAVTSQDSVALVTATPTAARVNRNLDAEGMFTHTYMQELLSNAADNFYLTCTIAFDGKVFHAIDVDNGLRVDFRDIEDLGPGLVGDSVYIEPDLHSGQWDAETGKLRPYYGKVYQLKLKKNHAHYKPILACVADSGRLKPVDEDLPELYNLVLEKNLQQVKNGHICVYNFTRNNEITFHHYEKVDVKDKAKKVFVVRLLRYEPRLRAHVGIVIGQQSAGVTSSTGSDLIHKQFDVAIPSKPETDELLNSFFGSTPVRSPSMEDFTRIPTFTVENTDYHKSLAFSLSHNQSPDVNSRLYTVGIHVPNLKTIKKDDPLDCYALERGVSFPKLPILPGRVQESLGLGLGKEKHAVSFLIQTTYDGLVKDWRIAETVVKVDHELTLEEIEKILTEGSLQFGQEWNNVIEDVMGIAESWRRERLGVGSLVTDPVNTDALNAVKMVEEIRVAANCLSAMFLIREYGSSTLVLAHSPPDLPPLKVWRHQHLQAARTCLALRRHHLPPGKTCVHQEADCECLGALPAPEPVTILTDTWDKLLQKASRGDFEGVERLVHCPYFHPPSLLAVTDLSAISHRDEYSQYTCREDQCIHYQHNRKGYTPFTDVFSHYGALVVQRQILSALEKGVTSSPYHQNERLIVELSRKLNDRLHKRHGYDELDLTFQYGLHLSLAPLQTHLLISDVTPTSLTFKVFNLPNLAFNKTLLFKHLGAETVEVIQRKIVVTWTKRVYSTSGLLSHTESVNSGNNGSECVELDANRFVRKMESGSWNNLLKASSDNVCQVALRLRNSVSPIEDDKNYATEVYSQCKDARYYQHVCQFQQVFDFRQVLFGQLSGQLQNALLRPRLQLLNLTEKLDICLEHSESPLRCFGAKCEHVVYDDLAGYQRSLEEIQDVEAITDSLRDAIVIHDCNIKWDGNGDGNDVTCGYLQLPAEFCRSVSVFQNRTPSGVGENYTLGYVCVRYKNLDLESDSSFLPPAPGTWVAHGRITNVSLTGRRRLVSVKIQLTHTSSPPPPKLGSSDVTCSVEIFMKPQQNVSRDVALLRLSDCLQHVQDLFLSNNRQNAATNCQDLAPPLPSDVASVRPSAGQTAVLDALHKPVIVCKGGSGTGKSQLSVLIASRLLNGTNERILLTAPDQTSLDIISDFLQWSQVSDVVRLYPESYSCHDYPHPGALIGQKPANQRRVFAVHHLIRCTGKDAGRIKSLDDKFASGTFGDCDVDEYLALVESASLQLLKKSRLLLATCQDVGQNLMRKFLENGESISRMIVDDCQLCQDAELLIPITLLKPNQLIFLGDPSQSRPCCSSPVTWSLGLMTSWLERYRARTVFNLTDQYTMTKSLSLLPSQLSCLPLNPATRSQEVSTVAVPLWTDPEKPLLWLDNQHREVTVPGHRGARGIINASEALELIRVFGLLVDRYDVTMEDVCVLATTDEQRLCLESMEPRIKELGLVRSLTEAHGRTWPYVLVSMVTSVSDADHVTSQTSDVVTSLNDERVTTQLLTRARKAMMIFGNASLLSQFSGWRKVVDKLKKEGSLMTAQDYFASH